MGIFMSINIKQNKLSPLLKYPGGKEKELKYILPNLPKIINNYYEPFVGGGAVYFSLNCPHYFINDKSTELIQLYQLIAKQDIKFLEKINGINTNWSLLSHIIKTHTAQLIDIYIQYKSKNLSRQQLSDLVTEFVCANTNSFNDLLKSNFNIAIENFVLEVMKSLKNKIIRMVAIEEKKGTLSTDDLILNLEGAFKSAFYMHFRYLYNHIEELSISKPFATAIYFFIREFCYSSMFRYNRNGKFNVPYGGISYNQKSLSKKIAYFQSEELISQLSKTTISSDDFEQFFSIYKPQKDDFIFLDPPYDSEFSTYAKNEFTKEDQIRLANFLIKQCPASFMLIIKNTDFILNLYPKGHICKNGQPLFVTKFDKKYFVSFQDRNNKHAEHLLITNYQLSTIRP